MNRAETYLAEAERCRQAGNDAFTQADDLVVGKTEVSDDDQSKADDLYSQAEQAFTKAKDWERRSKLAEAADEAERFAEGQRRRNRLPQERAADVGGSRLNDAPTALELAERSQALTLRFAGQHHDEDAAFRRWPVESLFVLALRERCTGGEIMTAEQREAWAGYSKTSREARYALAPTQKADTDNVGGVLVPEYLDSMIRDAAKFEGPLADDSRISVIMQGSTGVQKIPRATDVNDDDKQPERLAEAADATIKSFGFDEVTLTPENFAVMIVLTDQILMADVISVEPYLARKVGELFGRRQNRFFTSGTGNQQPKGVTQIGAGRHVTTAAKGVVAEADVINLLKRLDAAYHGRPSTFCMMHQNAIFDLMKLRDNGELVFPRTPNGMNVVLPGGNPLVANNRLSVPDGGNSAAGDVFMVIGDFSDYTKVQVGGLMTERERYLRSYQWLVGFNTYLDASPIIEDAYALLKSAA